MSGGRAIVENEPVPGVTGKADTMELSMKWSAIPASDGNNTNKTHV